MKALGLKILNYISVLYQLGAITADERKEFAMLIQLAMGRDNMYRSVLVKLNAVADKAGPNTLAGKYAEECIELIQSVSSQTVG